MKKLTIFDSICLYLGNDAKQGHSYYVKQTGCHTWHCRWR